MRNLKVTRAIFCTRSFRQCSLVLGVLLFLVNQAHAVVLIRDETIGISVPAFFHADNYRHSVSVQTGIQDLQLDPASNLLISERRAGLLNYSSSQPQAATYDLETVISGGGVIGSTYLQAGNGTSSVSMTLSSIDVSPAGYGTSLSASAGEYGVVRFVSPTDRRVEVEASYQLGGSISAQNSPSDVSRAFGVFYMFDLDSFGPTRVIGDSIFGEADFALADISEPGELYVPQTVNAWTNRDYILISGAIVTVDVDSIFRAAVDISLQASATAPTFFSADSDVSIVRSALASNPTAVAEPSLLGLLGLGLVGLLRRRRAINLH